MDPHPERRCRQRRTLEELTGLDLRLAVILCRINDGQHRRAHQQLRILFGRPRPQVEVRHGELRDLGHQPRRAEDASAQPGPQLLPPCRIGELDRVGLHDHLVHLPLDRRVIGQPE